MNLLLALCIFFTLFSALLFIGITYLPQFYFRVRVRKFLMYNKKNNFKLNLESNKKKRPLSLAIQNIEIKFKVLSLPITFKEFLLILFWVNLFIFLSGFLIGFNIVFILFGIFDSMSLLFIYLSLKRRKKKINQQLPEVLSLISNSLKSGYSIMQTIDIVSKENNPPISQEFLYLSQALQFGENFEKAFVDFSKRIDIPEVVFVVDSILITKETGGNLTKVIDGLLEVIWENNRLIGEIRSISAQGRISGIVIGALPTLLFLVLYLISPDYILTLFNNAIGFMLLIFAAILQLIGFLILYKITHFKLR